MKKARSAQKEETLHQYEFTVECTILKTCIVEAHDEEEATTKMNKWVDVIDERENGMSDWEIKGGPRLAD